MRQAYGPRGGWKPNADESWPALAVRCPTGPCRWCSRYKRTLLVDRANSLGWRHQLVDFASFGLFQNAAADSERIRSSTSRSTRVATPPKRSAA